VSCKVYGAGYGIWDGTCTMRSECKCASPLRIPSEYALHLWCLVLIVQGFGLRVLG
jgi:hypothetical protein